MAGRAAGATGSEWGEPSPQVGEVGEVGEEVVRGVGAGDQLGQACQAEATSPQHMGGHRL